MVKDKELMEKIHPQILTFIDTNFFFSPSQYGKAFYEDLKESFRKYNFFIIVRETQRPGLLSMFPEMKEKTIGVSVDNGNGYKILDDQLSTKSVGNILTEIMLPVALAIGNDISIAGCTGRTQGETYFWEHNGRVQYLDLKPSVFEMWPSFFKYRDYDDYYENHCKIVEEWMEYGERLGNRFNCITSSFIPALNDRRVDWN